MFYILRIYDDNKDIMNYEIVKPLSHNIIETVM